MDKFSLLARLRFILFLLLALCLSVWAGDSTTVNHTDMKKPGSPLLWKTGIIYSVNSQAITSPSPYPYPVSPACPAGWVPSYSVAVGQGYVASSGSSDDKGIRGIHLKVNRIYTDPDANYIYMIFSEAYVDTIGQADKPIDVYYTIYCSP